MNREIHHPDLHMHTTISDGTDAPEEILGRVKDAGVDFFSVTDHDAFRACFAIRPMLREGDPYFIPGVEFSCRDELGKYHILGYAFDPEGESIRTLTDRGHTYRLKKLSARVEFLKEAFGMTFPKEEIAELFTHDNPGKPHLGNLMVKYGYAKNKDEAIRNYINKKRVTVGYIRPEEAIAGILGSGGVPVLAHPAYGDGDQLILGDELTERVDRLVEMGLEGLETYYSGFTDRLISDVSGQAKRHDLYITAGSDYHGTNKLVELGNTNLPDAAEAPEAFARFLARVLPERKGE